MDNNDFKTPDWLPPVDQKGYTLTAGKIVDALLLMGVEFRHCEEPCDHAWNDEAIPQLLGAMMGNTAAHAVFQLDEFGSGPAADKAQFGMFLGMSTNHRQILRHGALDVLDTVGRAIFTSSYQAMTTHNAHEHGEEGHDCSASHLAALYGALGALPGEVLCALDSNDPSDWADVWTMMNTLAAAVDQLGHPPKSEDEAIEIPPEMIPEELKQAADQMVRKMLGLGDDDEIPGSIEIDGAVIQAVDGAIRPDSLDDLIDHLAEEFGADLTEMQRADKRLTELRRQREAAEATDADETTDE
jgi:hypothetical protein